MASRPPLSASSKEASLQEKVQADRQQRWHKLPDSLWGQWRRAVPIEDIGHLGRSVPNPHGSGNPWSAQKNGKAAPRRQPRDCITAESAASRAIHNAAVRTRERHALP